MAASISLVVCQYKDCSLIYDRPVILTCCGESICEKHVDNLKIDSKSNIIKCYFCNEEYELPQKGLILNKAMLKLAESVDFGLSHKKAKESLNDLINKIIEFDMILNNSSNFVHGYFRDIKNQMDLNREELKMFIDDHFDKLLKQTESHEKRCLSNCYLLKFDQIDKDLSEVTKSKIDNFRLELRKLNSNIDSWDKITNNISTNITAIDQKCETLKREILSEKTFKYLFTKIDEKVKKIDQDVLGKLSVIDLNKQVSQSAANNLKSCAFISCSGDNEICIWEPNPFKLINRFVLPNQTIKFGFFTVFPNKRLLTSSIDKTIKLWNVDKCTCEKIFKQESNSSCLLFINDTEFLSGNLNGCIYVWDINNTDNKYQKVFSKHWATVTCLKLLKNSNKLISGSSDKTVKIWDFLNGTCLNTLSGHTGSINAIKVITGQTNKLVTCSDDHNVIIWDLNGTANNVILKQKSAAVCMELIGSNKLVVGLSSGMIMVWDLAKNKCVGQYTLAHKMSITSLKYLPYEKKIYSCSFDMKVHSWDVTNFKKIDTLSMHSNPIYYMDLY